MIVSLEEAKQHVRADPDGDDDALIELYIGAAEDQIRNYLNSEIPGLEFSPTEVPAAIKAGALLIIGDLYENREAKIVGTTAIENSAVVNLLHPYRVDLGV